MMVLRISVLVCLLLPQALFSANPGKRSPPSSPVSVVEVSRRAMAPTIWVAGTVVSKSDARVAAELSGRLTWVADLGASVARGQPVATLHISQQRLQLVETKALVAKENARLVFLKQEVSRLQRLAKQNVAAINLLEQAQADLEVANSELRAVRVRQQLAADRVSRGVLKAPFSGVVTERLRRKGEWVNNGDAVVRLLDSKSLEIQAKVPLSSMAVLAVNQTLRLQDDEEGVIQTLVPAGDDRSRLLDLRIGFDAIRWPVGQSVRVAIPTALARDVLALPRDALVLRRSGVAVFKVDAAGRARKVQVEIGVAEGSLIEVRGSGLQVGDKVVVRGGERLRSGAKVRILDAVVTP